MADSWKELSGFDNNSCMLAAVDSPYTYLQILWLHTACPYGKWVAVVVNVKKDLHEQLREQCERSGIFSEVVVADVDESAFRQASLLDKGKLFLRMFAHFVTGRKKAFCRQIIRQYYGDIAFTHACVPCNWNISYGALINVLPKGHVFMVEEGSGDYAVRKTWPAPTLYGLIAWCVAKMGYMNIVTRDNNAVYRMRYDQKCLKFVTDPDRMSYRNYLCLSPILSAKVSDEFQTRFRELSSNVFFSDQDIQLDDFDVVVFTTVFTLFPNPDVFVDMTRAFLRAHYKNARILIKFHHRDRYEYDWPELNITKAYAFIPGEVLIPLLTKQKLIMLYPSSLAMSFERMHLNYQILKFENVNNPQYTELFQNAIDLGKINESTIVPVRETL